MTFVLLKTIVCRDRFTVHSSLCTKLQNRSKTNMSLNCNDYESRLIDVDKIGVCTGSCSDEADCLSNCGCYSVDLDWQPNLQDYTTYDRMFCVVLN